MHQNDCKCINIEDAHLTLNDRSVQTVRYCLECGKVQNNVNVEPTTEPIKRTHISWEDRRKAAEERKAANHLSWEERRARRQQQKSSGVKSTATTQPAEISEQSSNSDEQPF